MVSTVIDLFFDEHLAVLFVASERSLYMRWKIRAVLVLIGIAAAAVGAQMYLSVTQGVIITEVGSIVQWFKTVGIAAVLMVGGTVLSAKAILPSSNGRTTRHPR